MSSLRRHPTPLAAEPVALPAAASVDEQADWPAPHWPVTRLANAAFTVLLAGGLVAPWLVGPGPVLLAALAIPAVVATAGTRVAFEVVVPGSRRSGPARALRALVAAGLGAALMAACGVLAGAPLTPVRAWGSAGLALAATLGAGELRAVEIRVRAALRRVYFVGTAAGSRDLQTELRRSRDAGFAGAAASATAHPDHLARTIRTAGATVLVLDSEAMRRPELVEMAARLNVEGIHIRDLVTYYEAEFKKVPLPELSPTWFLFDIAPIHRRWLARAVRRGVEVSVAAGLLILLAPILLLAAVAVGASGPGPILYRQRRVGRGGVPFTLLKLRTMRPGAEGTDAARWAQADAHRVTRTGRGLRRYRIDELPQLWNVIRGDLALIGPRPEQIPIARRLEDQIPFYGARHCIRPGLTGWAQVNLGYAGSVEGTLAKLQRDLYYIKHAGPRLDALIIWLTVRTVVSGRG